MIHYPAYIPKFDQNKQRAYPSESELLRTNPHLKGMSNKKRKELNRHHINGDRSDGVAENLHVVDSKTHTQLHQQLQAITTELIKVGIIKYDRNNPHYYIANEHVKSKLVKPFKVESVKRDIGKELAKFV